MIKLAIQGHPTRGKEVIQIFKDLGTEVLPDQTGSFIDWVYFRDDSLCPNQLIIGTDITFLKQHGYNVYTLEEFEKEFPFKIGTKVIIPDYSNKKGTIINIKSCGPILSYLIKLETGNGVYRTTKSLKLYKEMQERNITLTLDKAKEWYKKDGELKEIALQAYSEEELTKVELPKTWEEFCENYPVKIGECWLAQQDIIHQALDFGNRIFKNWIPSQKSAEAHLAMIQLEQLRDCWRQGWIPKKHESVYTIKFAHNGLDVYQFCSREFLSFPTREMAEKFLKCFRDLIEKAGDLI